MDNERLASRLALSDSLVWRAAAPRCHLHRIARVLIWALLICAGCGENTYPETWSGPHAIRIVWADGATGYPGWCEGHVPAAFSGDRETYAAGIRGWLAPFDAYLTEEDIPSPLVTVLVSSGYSEDCSRPSGWLGRAVYGQRGSWANIWQAGLGTPEGDAAVVAHEIGHAVGDLVHVHDEGSIMNPWVSLTMIAYEDRWIATAEGAEGVKQNAYEAMLAALGPSKAAP